jgi:hypothetical protein
MAIKSCNCLSVFQDARYGVGKRVHNVKDDKSSTCTVCGKTNAAALPSKKKEAAAETGKKKAA